MNLENDTRRYEISAILRVGRGSRYETTGFIFLGGVRSISEAINYKPGSAALPCTGTVYMV